MSIVSALKEYRNYNKNESLKKQDKVLNRLWLCAFSLTSISSLYLLFLDKIVEATILCVFMISFSFIFSKSETKSNILNKMKKSSPHTDSLYLLFDKECPYTQEILKKQHDNIKKDISMNKGLSSSLVLNLEEEIEYLKIVASDDKKVRVYQDIYYIMRGEENSLPLVEGSERAKICYEIDRKGRKAETPFPLIVCTCSLMFMMYTTILYSSFLFFGNISIVEKEHMISGLIGGNLIGLVFLCLPYIFKHTFFAKESKKSLYDIVKGNSVEAQNTITEYVHLLVDAYKQKNKFTRFDMYLLEARFERNIKRAAEKLNKEEEESVLIESGTKLGTLLSDVKNLK